MIQSSAQDEIENILSKIMRAYTDFEFAHRLFVSSMRSLEEYGKIYNTQFAKALVVIQNALLHRAALALTKIYEDSSGDRFNFDKLFKLMTFSGFNNIDELKKDRVNILLRNEYGELKKIRDGRAVHIIPSINSEVDININTVLDAMRFCTKSLMQKTRISLGKEEISGSEYARLNRSSKAVWDCLYNEGHKYLNE